MNIIHFPDIDIIVNSTCTSDIFELHNYSLPKYLLFGEQKILDTTRYAGRIKFSDMTIKFNTKVAPILGEKLHIIDTDVEYIIMPYIYDKEAQTYVCAVDFISKLNKQEEVSNG